MRLTPARATRLVAAPAAIALLLAGCSGAAEDSAPPEPPPYDSGEGISARVLPRLADVGSEPRGADQAAYVVEATLEEPEEGREVVVQALDGDEWTEVASAETDEDGEAVLTTTASGELRVTSGSDDDLVGITVDTGEAPVASWTDDFDEDSFAGDDARWTTRDQGYHGVRQCSKAADEATEVADGVLRVSVIDDPDREQCRVGNKRYDYRLNGHVGTQDSYTFTYGYAAARIRFQDERGQHGAFWLQSAIGAPVRGPGGGSEIDIIEYFGDDHPQGGLTSFVYSYDKSGEGRTRGGWIEDSESYGGGWSDEYHVFSVEWTPEEYVFRIDGQVTHRLEGNTSAQPEFLILSLLSSDYELKHSDELPATMEVDWVRVWETGS